MMVGKIQPEAILFDHDVRFYRNGYVVEIIGCDVSGKLKNMTVKYLLVKILT